MNENKGTIGIRYSEDGLGGKRYIPTTIGVGESYSSADFQMVFGNIDLSRFNEVEKLCNQASVFADENGRWKKAKIKTRGGLAIKLVEMGGILK